MINELLESLSTLITQRMWLAPLLALFTGVLTSFTPCSLSSVPLVISCVGGTKSDDTRKAFKLSIVFAIGTASTFTALGVAASLMGKLMQGTGSWWFLILGVLMLLMALQTWELFNFIPSSYAISKNKKKGYIGAFIAGILAGFFSSPCSTPALIVILAFVAKEGNILFGTLLLLLYSIGHSVLVIIAGTSIGFVRKITSSNKYGNLSFILKILMGLIMLLLSFYMFYLGF